jgi:2-polyprenyl-6-methoxyphenol hydroxylase-like FAD-dependent oxidoreductase
MYDIIIIGGGISGLYTAWNILKKDPLKRVLHRPKRKMRQNAVMIYIFYNYVSGSLLNVPLLFSSLKY